MQLRDHRITMVASGEFGRVNFVYPKSNWIYELCERLWKGLAVHVLFNSVDYSSRLQSFYLPRCCGRPPVPRLEIFDGRGEAILEKFYEVGSSIDLRCDAYHVAKDAIVWSRAGAKVYHTPDAGVSVETSSGVMGPVSRLSIKTATTTDSGNYSCSAPEADTATVRIQVLDGESSAAMQHSTNSSSASASVFTYTLSTMVVLATLSLVIAAGC
nr:uncharacterized protein LOC123751519 [Procambarus clarkii]